MKTSKRNVMLTGHRSLSTIALIVTVVLGLISSQVAYAAAPPIQTYFVPMPEDDLIAEFEAINSGDVTQNGYVRSLISIAVAAPGTVIYYDHWEDGYEVDVTNLPPGSTTSVWGDSNTANNVPVPSLAGFITGIPASDSFSGGESIILENPVDVPRDSNVFRFDGSDRILVSFPVAVSRAAYPTNNGSPTGSPGSLLGGGTEVLDSDSYGTSFEIPVGQNTPDDSNTDPFERVTAHVMAAQDVTEVFLNGVSQGTIDAGETIVRNVNQNDTITTGVKGVQVSLITGDVGSTYEMRWYSLTPRDQWGSDYYTPVGSDSDDTQVWLYNPNNSAISVTYERGNGPGNAITSSTITIPAKSTGVQNIELSPDTSNDSGARFFTANDDEFFAVTQTDTDGSGQIKDWGHPLVPANQLTSQALVGLGYGNTSNSASVDSRSVVWVTPVANAWINIDYDGDGTIDDSILVDRLDNLRIRDSNNFSPSNSSENDQDMSGATIFATTGSNGSGDPIDIAVAWGQDPPRSFSGDSEGLDLGTLVPPLPILEAGKSASLFNDVNNDGNFDPGDTIEYTIVVVNFGRVNLPANIYNILDFFSPVFDDTNYVAGSTEYTYDDGATTIAITDDTVGTLFPLDVDATNGFNNSNPIAAKEVQSFAFRAEIDPFENLTPGSCAITNKGVLRVNGESIDEFEVTVPLDFDPAIDIQKTVYIGHDGGASCPGIEKVTGPIGTDVTYCFEVTNAGDTYLSSIQISDPDLGGNVGSSFGPLAPGASETRFLQSTIAGNLTNTATATGNPTYADGTDLPCEDDVSASDTAEVEEGALAVTLGYFLAEQDGDKVKFIWQTATETGTAGFNLLAESAGGLVQLNDELIPSKVIDSVEVTDYSYEATTAATVFYIEELEVSGKTDRIGPFVLGIPSGVHTGVSTQSTPAIWLPMIIQ